MRILTLFTVLMTELLFNACEEEDSGSQRGSGCSGVNSVTDIDGNVYNVVEIGNQCWMKENLRVSADIVEVYDEAQWDSISNYPNTPAWCYYDNWPTNGNTYGKLYNWYAVNTGKLCPTGWHIPTDDDWKTLEMNLGMSQAEADKTGYRPSGGYSDSTGVGGMLKATTFGRGATNSSGFTALPGGNRNYDGRYNGLGTLICFWTSTERNQPNAWYRILSMNTATISRNEYYKEHGFYCRCVKD